jgi:hypothetical protein
MRLYFILFFILMIIIFIIQWHFYWLFKIHLILLKREWNKLCDRLMNRLFNRLSLLILYLIIKVEPSFIIWQQCWGVGIKLLISKSHLTWNFLYLGLKLFYELIRLFFKL